MKIEVEVDLTTVLLAAIAAAIVGTMAYFTYHVFFGQRPQLQAPVVERRAVSAAPQPYDDLADTGLQSYRPPLTESERAKLDAEALARLAERQRLYRAWEASAKRPVSGIGRAYAIGEGNPIDELRGRYVFALAKPVQDNWLRPDTARAGLMCTIRIVQDVGGVVLQAIAVPPCNADPLTKTSLEAAVLRASPLPYEGFESVYQREIDLRLHYDG